MGYLEEIFQRAELKFKDIHKAKEWLKGFGKGTQNPYTNEGVKLYSELVDSEKLSAQTQEARSLKKVNSLIESANSIETDLLKDEVLGELNNRLAILEGEAEDLKNTIKETRSFSELEQATERLREISPQKLGGIKSGETRFRGSKKEEKLVGESFRSVFD